MRLKLRGSKRVHGQAVRTDEPQKSVEMKAVLTEEPKRVVRAGAVVAPWTPEQLAEIEEMKARLPEHPQG